MACFFECVHLSFTLMKTQDWVKTSVYFDNNICPTIPASGVSLSVIGESLSEPHMYE